MEKDFPENWPECQSAELGLAQEQDSKDHVPEPAP